MSLRVDVVGALGAGGESRPFDGPGTRIFQGTLLLGRLPGRLPALTLQSPQVDAEHALIYVSPEDGAWHIRDLGSARGTWLLPGPSRIEDCALSGTRTLVLGDTIIRVTVLPDG
jgi:hypothetical protein